MVSWKIIFMEVFVMNEKKRFYQKKWFLWLWLIIFPPVGIILLWTLHKTMKKKTKIILSVIFALWFIILIGASGNSSDTPTNIGNDATQAEQGQDIIPTEDSTIEKDEEEKEEYEEREQETDSYGWTSDDYTEFEVALNMVADNYLTQFKLPHYTKWQFAKFDDKGRIFAMTDNLTFKDSHEKHIVICVFSLAGEVGESGLHEKVLWNYFATDEKTYYDDGSCDSVFEIITSLSD